MKNFYNYAKYYDQMYQDKSYLDEVNFIKEIFSTRENRVNTILDLGCGTGTHLNLLAEEGFSVTGVDLANEMIDQAKVKASKGNLAINFLVGDLRTIRLGIVFDAILSMFAVMSYQTNNSDLISAFVTARQHLNPGGLFIFDAWYGPAVLSQKPETRVKEFVIDNDRVIRIATPETVTIRNIVKVNYSILRVSGNKIVDEVHEIHSMRYLFVPEVELLAEKSGFIVEKICPFLELGEIPDQNDWNVTWILKAI